MRLSLPVCLLLALLGGCGGGGGDSSQAGAPEPPSTPMEPPTEPADPPVLPAAAVDWDRNLLAVDLELDLERLQGTAIISVEQAASEALSLEVGDLEVHEVRAEINGAQVSLNHAREAAALHIGFPRDAQGGAVEIRYAFSVKEDFSGYSADGYTFLWPYFCGNLFPCKSQPGDGVVFDLRLVGIDPSNTAVFPPSIPNDSVRETEYGYYIYGTRQDCSADSDDPTPDCLTLNLIIKTDQKGKRLYNGDVAK